MWQLSQPPGNLSHSKEYDRLQNMYSALSSLQKVTTVFTSAPWKEKIIENLQLHDNILHTWASIDRKNMLFPLLKNMPNMTFDQIFDKVGGRQDDIIQDCLMGGILCNNFKPITISSGLFPRCFRYATSKGMETRGFEDGISKGITFIFKPGAQLMSAGYYQTVSPLEAPKFLFTNYRYPSSSNGIRLTTSHPSTNPNIDEEGFDISPGFHTVVALTAKEIIRLPWPYSECTHVDYEMQKLQERVMSALGSVSNNQTEDNPTYSQQECQSACLQRLIFESCNCLDSETKLPFKDVDPSHFCMILQLHEVHMFLEPERYNKRGCFHDPNEFISQNCSFLHKIINDLACVKRVKRDFTERKLSGDSACNCPPGCYTYEYEVSTSQSLWPAPGYEMSLMWYSFVYFTKWNYTFGNCQEFTDCTTFQEMHPINSSECKGEDRQDLRFVF